MRVQWLLSCAGNRSLADIKEDYVNVFHYSGIDDLLGNKKEIQVRTLAQYKILSNCL
jgi:hypothetical protein